MHTNRTVVHEDVNESQKCVNLSAWIQCLSWLGALSETDDNDCNNDCNSSRNTRDISPRLHAESRGVTTSNCDLKSSPLHHISVYEALSREQFGVQEDRQTDKHVMSVSQTVVYTCTTTVMDGGSEEAADNLLRYIHKYA